MCEIFSKIGATMSRRRPWNTSLSSLVITLSDEGVEAASAVSAIGNHPSITASTREGRYLPIVIEDADARPIHRWLEELPGVAFVDVVFCSTETA